MRMAGAKIPLEGFERSVAVCSVVIIAFEVLSAAWVHKFSSKINPGFWRFFTILPIMAGNFLVPFLFDHRIFSHIQKESALAGLFFSVFLIAWVNNCKVLAYAFNRGYLAKVEKWSTWKFLGVYILPIQPKVVNPEDKNLGEEQALSTQDKMKIKFIETCRLVLRILIKICLLLLWSPLAVLSYDSGPILTALLYNGILMVWLGQTLDLAQLFALICFNIPCIDPFNHPYLSSDFTDMWANRWNTMTAGVMKPLSYDIIRDGYLVRPADEVYAKTEKPQRSLGIIAVAVISTFSLSGLLHFMVFWYITRSFAWSWFYFFAAFGPIVIMEGVVKNFFQTSLGIKSLPWYIGIPFGTCYTLGISMLLASVWFTPPALDAGVESLVDVYQKFFFGSHAF